MLIVELRRRHMYEAHAFQTNRVSSLHNINLLEFRECVMFIVSTSILAVNLKKTLFLVVDKSLHASDMSDLRVSKEQMFLPRSLVKIQYCEELP